MSRLLAICGLVGSVLYLIFVFWIVGNPIPELQGMKLNEVGDFFAGAFGPLAILWLVLGFFQQGMELRQGTQALLLQAQELKNSVQQQTIMAAAATQQIDAQQLALRMQEEEIIRGISPSLFFDTGFRQQSPNGDVQTNTTITNRGHEVWDFRITFDPPIGHVDSYFREKLEAGGEMGLPFQFNCNGENLQGRCAVTYLRKDGHVVEEEFVYQIPSANPFVYIKKLAPVRRD